MKIFSITAVLLAMFISVPAQAEIKIHTYNIGAPIEFKTSKPVWYQSNYFHIPKTDKLPFEVALDSSEVEKGEWSMHFTNPKAPLTEKIDLTSHLFFVGMRYKFDK